MISVLPARGALEFLRTPKKVIERQGAKAAKETTPRKQRQVQKPHAFRLFLAV
jgi:hypothetical protein